MRYILIKGCLVLSPYAFMEGNRPFDERIPTYNTHHRHSISPPPSTACLKLERECVCMLSYAAAIYGDSVAALDCDDGRGKTQKEKKTFKKKPWIFKSGKCRAMPSEHENLYDHPRSTEIETRVFLLFSFF